MLQRHPSSDLRLQEKLQRRLLCAPPDLRTVATADRVRVKSPDFALTPQQQSVAEAQLRSLADARTAFRGRADHDDFDVDPFPNSSSFHKQCDRAAVMGEAIVDFDRTSRVLRQWGLKLSISSGGATGIGSTELTYRRAANER
jgi:hypothetical protein